MAKITYEDKEFLNKKENIADKNKVNDTDLNEIKEVVNGNYDEFLIRTNVIYDKTLESAQSSVSIPCDIVADGGAYEFIFIIQPNTTSPTSDYKMYFNDNNSIQYAINMFGATGNLTAEGNLTQRAVYRGYQTMLGDYWGSSIDLKVPIVLEGKIMLVDDVYDNAKKLFVETKFNSIIHQSQVMIFHNIISVNTISNLTKINLTQANTSVSNYGIGSRFILKKI